MKTQQEKQADPSKIIQIGMGFWASKTLLTAVNMKLFTLLAKGELSANEIRNKLGLHKRSLYDFLDTLFALGFLQRTGIKETAIYSNSMDANIFLDQNKPSYIGGILEMSNNRLYPFWNDLEEGLRTGMPQNETKNDGESVFEKIYANENTLREFLKAMGGIQIGNFIALAEQFDFSKYQTHCDMGGAGASLSIQIALHNKNISCNSFDLPPVHNIAIENINAIDLSERITVLSGDFFESEFPKADVITMGNVLHDWDLIHKKILIKKSYEALPKGGALIVIENIIDDNRSQNAFGLMMSLNMMIETEGGFDFSAADFKNWAYEAGFKSIEVMPLTGPSSAVIAYK